MSTLARPRRSALPEPLPAFAYPCLATRLAPAFHHLILLPEGRSEADLLALARRQVACNRLQAALILGPRRAFYFGRDGTVTGPAEAPLASIHALEGLAPAEPVADEARTRAVARWAAVSSGDGFVLGDLRKGGRPAMPGELAELAERGPAEAPRGLSQCGKCGEWHGCCLDPDPRWAGLVMEVCCLCQADSRCAACGELLSDRRPNANRYDPATDSIWHVPGFTVLGHRCRTRAGRE